VTSEDKPSPEPSEEGTSQQTVVKFWIEYRGHKIELRSGATLLGRSANCQIVLDDGLVSRRHAQIKVDRQRAVLEDFGSVNGVFVNGVRILREQELHDGDVIKMGKQEMTLHSVAIAVMDASVRLAAETLHGGATLNRPGSSGGTRERAPSSPANSESFELLGNVAEKVLALGRGEEAERMLSGSLQALLSTSRSGGKIQNDVADKAAWYAVRLVSATHKALWADYVFELFMNLRRPLPGPAVDELYSALRAVSGVDLTLLRNYVALLQALQHSFGPNERFLAQRIEGLERLVTL